MALPRVRFYPAKGSNFMGGRAGHVPIAVVHHRMVGYLTGTRRLFTVSSTRPVSTHFGIGFEGGRLAVDQYVYLEDTAYGNGNWDASGGWKLTKRTATGAVVNPNLYTVSIEHEDGASANRGVVSPAVIQASRELVLLLTSGNRAAIEAAGVRIARTSSSADRMVKALAKLRATPDAEHFPDHHRIAGKLKPYCFRRWLDDPGWWGVVARQGKLLEALQGKEDDDVRTFQVPEKLSLGTPKEDAARPGNSVWLFSSSDLKPDGTEVSLKPIRPLVLVATDIVPGVAALAYEPATPDDGTTSRVVFLAKANLAKVELAPVADAGAIAQAAKAARAKALTEASAASSAAIAALPR